ncbi:MAG TPA: 50S ribosomal protein L29 [Candidatus Pacearchaeota archaeon]|jgi:large subunit ribosomal protein L29|nr:50S ribosomal protein L29 [Candidatus Pacearchaeota archaeon]HRR94534.1 50S ribosomal protein L29 [Candidatus Paceibacterota bacterium]HPC30399.1 50S ribosomal protein L29 [Candidatus Pacearchaeota archaeon]HQG09107.1 50S ribosomal protein L29 [Candidatus Pacearchaeota archaeon]HQH20091.1 50S ribosomal protein L29 [Candidatus Pacearchaeota archaeon]
MKSKELTKKTKEELLKELEDLRNKIKEMRFKLASGGLKNVKELKESKKQIARILTILRNNQIDNSINK